MKFGKASDLTHASKQGENELTDTTVPGAPVTEEVSTRASDISDTSAGGVCLGGNNSDEMLEIEPHAPGTNHSMAIIPENSILTDYMNYAREFSESEDSTLIGSILPILGALLARRVYIDFAGNKYPNLDVGA